jgi:hypothetical protein
LAGALDGLGLLAAQVTQLLAEPLLAGDEGGEGGLAVLGEVDQPLDLELRLGGQVGEKSLIDLRDARHHFHLR